MKKTRKQNLWQSAEGKTIQTASNKHKQIKV